MRLYSGLHEVISGETLEKVSLTALERRYRLLPYIYTLAFTASVKGDPIMQPVFFADPKDPDCERKAMPSFSGQTC